MPTPCSEKRKLTKEIRQTFLEVFNHIVGAHPELLPAFERIIFEKQGKSIFDANFLLSVNSLLLKKSRSQLRQDLFVLSELNFKRNGYFVEFGATDGVGLSNTYLLESEYNWSGILAEPALRWHEALSRNRVARIDTRCVWKKTGESLVFNETLYPELSTIDSHSSGDFHAGSREDGKKYRVQTVSLIDLLREHNAPAEIDYLSIDTEGSEFDILEVFDFKEYRFKVVTCEHNYSPMRDRLNALFSKNGYKKKYESVSQFDDWWVLDCSN